MLTDAGNDDDECTGEDWALLDADEGELGDEDDWMHLDLDVGMTVS